MHQLLPLSHDKEQSWCTVAHVLKLGVHTLKRWTVMPATSLPAISTDFNGSDSWHSAWQRKDIGLFIYLFIWPCNFSGKTLTYAEHCVFLSLWNLYWCFVPWNGTESSDMKDSLTFTWTKQKRFLSWCNKQDINPRLLQCFLSFVWKKNSSLLSPWQVDWSSDSSYQNKCKSNVKVTNAKLKDANTLSLDIVVSEHLLKSFSRLTSELFHLE